MRSGINGYNLFFVDFCMVGAAERAVLVWCEKKIVRGAKKKS